MSFRYQKRINLGKGLGVNVSSSGLSTTYRTKFGSIGSRGFSLKTGIPGLSYRRGFGKSGLPIMLIYLAVMVGGLIVYNVVRLFFYLVAWAFDHIRFLIMRRRNANAEDSQRS
jgi:hypothetical protein